MKQYHLEIWLRCEGGPDKELVIEFDDTASQKYIKKRLRKIAWKWAKEHITVNQHEATEEEIEWAQKRGLAIREDKIIL